MDPSTTRNALRENLDTYLTQIAAGNVFAFAQYTKCTGSAVSRWVNGTYVPQLELILRVAKHLHVSVLSFYRSGGPKSSDLDKAKRATASVDRSVGPYRPVAEIREALSVFLY
jgi:transcriptional regulator with XRE-family HTH domain